MDLTKGQKLKLSSLTGQLALRVELQLTPPSQTDVDLSCFGLDGERKLSDDKYFIFYNQKASPCSSLTFESKGSGAAQFGINLDKLPPNIRRLVFTATLDGPGVMKSAGSGRFRLLEGEKELASFPFEGSEFADERALMIAEVYLKDPAPDREWRMAAVGQGFNGGLQALLEHFGGEVAEAAKPEPKPEPVAPPPPKVNLGKITLEKRGDKQKISLDKSGPAAVKPIHINLNWRLPQSSGLGAFLGMKKSADLDLGCMFELVTGEKGVIQPLGESFGSRIHPPYIFLDQDDRSGASASGENMYLQRPDTLKRCVIFAMIYEGSSNFTEVGGRVTLDDGRGTEITVHMNAPDPKRTFCAVCLLEQVQGSLQIQKEERYFYDHSDCDAHYGFGFRWVAGSK